MTVKIQRKEKRRVKFRVLYRDYVPMTVDQYLPGERTQYITLEAGTLQEAKEQVWNHIEPCQPHKTRLWVACLGWVA